MRPHGHGHGHGHGQECETMSLEHAILLAYGSSSVASPVQMRTANTLMVQASTDTTGHALSHAVRLLQEKQGHVQVHAFAAHLICEQLHFVVEPQQQQHLQHLLFFRIEEMKLR